MFRVLLAEQDLGVICGRLDLPDDRLKRLTGLPTDHLNFLQKHPTFRDKISQVGCWRISTFLSFYDWFDTVSDWLEKPTIESTKCLKTQ